MFLIKKLRIPTNYHILINIINGEKRTHSSYLSDFNIKILEKANNIFLQ
jgi:hypothetical protein